VVEDVMINRQYLPNLEAIYFLTPTEDSVNALIRDFDPSVKKKTMYSDVHVFFTSSTLLLGKYEHKRRADVERLRAT